MQELANRIANLNESATIKMAQMTRELKSQGRDIIDLSLGEPDFETPEHIKAAAKKAIDDGFTHYTPVAGYLDVRQAISEKFLKENDLHYAPEQIVISTGAKQSIINAVMCLVNPGDEVILPTPFWVSYSAMVKLAEGVIVEIPTSVESDFKISPAQLEAAITPKTKLIMFSSPCNPTGTVYTREELKVILSKPELSNDLKSLLYRNLARTYLFQETFTSEELAELLSAIIKSKMFQNPISIFIFFFMQQQFIIQVQ